MEVIRFVAFWSQIILSISLENLALNKPASQSTNLHENKWLAGAAVDGNGNQALNGNSCACTDHFKPTVWWKVNLGNVYAMSEVKIFYRNEGTFLAYRLSGFKLYVTLQNFIASSPVYVHNNGKQEAPHAPANFTVSVTTYGQYVTLYKDKSAACNTHNINNCALFELCEVEVMGCPKKKYSTNCQSDCPENCLYDVCAVSVGKCYGCKAGYTGDICNQPCVAGMYGPNCSKQCSGHCKDGASCDIRNGSCPDGCADGYKGIYCNETCSQGTYGSACSSECGSCRDNLICDHVHGSCPNGCGLGVTGIHCKTPCVAGTYGLNCSQKCSGRCKIGNSCDIINGSCLSGCSDGYKGTNCNETCSPGTFGSSCLSKCGSCRNNEPCNHVNGLCSEGCELGVTGQYCKTDIPSTTSVQRTSLGDFTESISTVTTEVSSMDTAKPTKTRFYTVTRPVLDTEIPSSSKNQNLTTALVAVSIFSVITIACLSVFIYIETRGRPSMILQNIRRCNKKKVPGNKKDDNMSRIDSQFSDLQSENNQRNDGSVLQTLTRDYETVRQPNIVDDQQYEVLRHGSVPEYSNTNQIF